jgi:hypothetical protein
MTTTTDRHPSMGKMFRDPITGYEGTATQRVEYLSGCFHIALERGDKDGKPQTEYFDEQRLVALEETPSHADEGERRSPGTPPPPLPHP